MKDTPKKKLNVDYRKIREDLTGAGRNVWLAGLGAVATVEEEGKAFFERLVERGKDFNKREKNVVTKTVEDVAGNVKKLGEKVEAGVQDGVASTLHRLGVPTHDEIQTLIARVEELSAKVDAMRAEK